MDLSSRVNKDLVSRANLKARTVGAKVHQALASCRVGLFIHGARQSSSGDLKALGARDSAAWGILRIDNESWGLGARDAVLNVRASDAICVVGLDVEDDRDDVHVEPKLGAEIGRLSKILMSCISYSEKLLQTSLRRDMVTPAPTNLHMCSAENLRNAPSFV
jgi:hypothetical protein